MTVVQSPVAALTRRSLLAGAAVTGLGVLAGCTAPGTDAGAGPANGFPRVVEHVDGRTDVPAEPRRVVSALDYDDLDAVLATGTAPVAFGFSPWLVPGLPPWAAGAAGSSRLDGPVAEINLEKIAAQAPDLIVAQADLLAGRLEQLQAIAPTVTVAVRGGDWRTGSRIAGRATGREAQAAAAIERAEGALAAARDALAAMRGTRVAVLGRYGGGVRVDSIDDGTASGGVLLRELGMVPVGGGADPGLRTISDEELTRFADVDVILLQDFGPETEQLFRLPTFAGLRPVRERRTARLSTAATRASYLLSALAVPYATREVTAALLAAMAGRGSTAPVTGER